MNGMDRFLSKIKPENFQTLRYIFVISLSTIFVFGFFMTSTGESSRPLEEGNIQEILGHQILVLNRVDQESLVQTRLQRESTARLIQRLDRGQPGRIQESMGFSIVHAAQKILVDRGRLERALEETHENLNRFKSEKTGWFQERLGFGILRAYQRAPESGPDFRSALGKELGWLRKTKERTFFRLNKQLGILMEQKTNFPRSSALKIKDAINSAARSERMRGNAERLPLLIALSDLEANLKWRRTPEDFNRLAGGIKEILKGYSGVGGFVEYGLPALLGLFMGMAWFAATVPHESPPGKTLLSDALLKRRTMSDTRFRREHFINNPLKEVFAMHSNISVFNWPQEVVWGNGASGEAGYYAKKNTHRRALVLTDEGIQQNKLPVSLTKSLDEARVQYQVNNQVQKDVPDTVVEEIFRKYKGMKIDLILALGGGSVIDTAKAVGILLSNGGTIRDYEGTDRIPNRIPPLYAIPTTAGCGSEASRFCLVLNTAKKKKMEIVSKRVIPEMVFIDPSLTLSLPPELTASSGMDALSNGIEAYFSTWANSLTDGKAKHAIELISESLRTAVANGRNVDARENLALAAFEAGLAFTNAHCGAVHALGHPLAGLFGIPEGVSSAILLPHVMRYNLNANLNRMVEVAEAMGEQVGGLSKRDAAEKAIQAVKSLIMDIGLPTTLNQVGVKKEAISEMSQQAQSDAFLEANPFTLRPRDIARIYEEAFVEYPPPLFRSPPPANRSIH